MESQPLERLLQLLQPVPGTCRLADNLLSDHSALSLKALLPAIGGTRLHVRVNPPYPGMAGEIESYLACGVTSIMVPMLRSAAEARQIVRCVRGCAEIIAMIETAEALAMVDELAALDGVAELYVGANDLARNRLP